MEPFNKKLGTETWHYAKRCFVSLLETLSKQMLLLKDSVYQDCLAFFDACEVHGKDIPTIVDPLMQKQRIGSAGPIAGVAAGNPDPKSSESMSVVSYEARLLKERYLALYGF